MVKLNLTVSALTFECTNLDEETAKILNVRRRLSDDGAAALMLSSLLADEKEFATLQHHVSELLVELRRNNNDNKDAVFFTTCNLVFSAPNAQAVEPGVDRSP